MRQSKNSSQNNFQEFHSKRDKRGVHTKRWRLRDEERGLIFFIFFLRKDKIVILERYGVQEESMEVHKKALLLHYFSMRLKVVLVNCVFSFPFHVIN